MTARFISVLRGRSSALVAVALVATAVTTAQAATIFTSALYNVTAPAGGSTGNNFQLNYNGGQVAGITSALFQNSPAIPGYNFVFAEKAGTNFSADNVAVANGSNSIGAAGDAGTVKLDGLTVFDPNDHQDRGAFLALDSVYQKSEIDIALTTVVGQVYSVSFDWAGTQQTLGVGATTDSLSVGFTGNPNQSTSSINVANQGFTGWFQVTDTFTATSTNSVLSFLASGTPVQNQQPAFTLLDNISVSSSTPPPPTIPEPNSLLLLSTGLVGIGGFIRSRFKK